VYNPSSRRSQAWTVTRVPRSTHSSVTDPWTSRNRPHVTCVPSGARSADASWSSDSSEAKTYASYSSVALEVRADGWFPNSSTTAYVAGSK
jgi:hypothetical protein